MPPHGKEAFKVNEHGGITQVSVKILLLTACYPYGIYFIFPSPECIIFT